MERILYSIFKDFGLDAVQLGFVVWFAWKLFTNHFAHLTQDITEIKDGIKEVEQKVDTNSERIAHVEGKLS